MLMSSLDELVKLQHQVYHESSKQPLRESGRAGAMQAPGVADGSGPASMLWINAGTVHRRLPTPSGVSHAAVHHRTGNAAERATHQPQASTRQIRSDGLPWLLHPRKGGIHIVRVRYNAIYAAASSPWRFRVFGSCKFDGFGSW